MDKVVYIVAIIIEDTIEIVCNIWWERTILNLMIKDSRKTNNI